MFLVVVSKVSFSMICTVVRLELCNNSVLIAKKNPTKRLHLLKNCLKIYFCNIILSKTRDEEKFRGKYKIGADVAQTFIIFMRI